VAKVGTSTAGGTISQQAAVHPWLAADVQGNKQTNITKEDSITFKTGRDLHLKLLRDSPLNPAGPQYHNTKLKVTVSVILHAFY
jgi:hypothetical protein